jgi:hypothetical protein
MLGGEAMLDRDGPRYALGIPLCIAGAATAYAAVFWKFVKRKIPNNISIGIDSIAKSPKWWLAIIFVYAEVIIFSPFVEERRFPFTNVTPTVTREPLSPEDITKATAPFRSELDSVKRQRDDAIAETASLRQKLSTGPVLGAISAFEMIQIAKMSITGLLVPSASYRPTEPKQLNWALVITHSPANQPLAKLVFQIFNGVLPNRISELPIPDHLNLDAPTYPPPSDSGEIIVHGESLFSDIFIRTMGRCFDVKKTKDTMHGLDEYYETSSGGAKPVWIEIENGNPVKENCTK